MWYASTSSVFALVSHVLKCRWWHFCHLNRWQILYTFCMRYTNCMQFVHAFRTLSIKISGIPYFFYCAVNIGVNGYLWGTKYAICPSTQVNGRLADVKAKLCLQPGFRSFRWHAYRCGKCAQVHHSPMYCLTCWFFWWCTGEVKWHETIQVRELLEMNSLMECWGLASPALRGLSGRGGRPGLVCLGRCRHRLDSRISNSAEPGFAPDPRTGVRRSHRGVRAQLFGV